MAGPGKLLSIALAFVALAFPDLASADQSRAPERTVAMMGAQVGGDADPALRTQLQDAVRRGLSAAGYSLIDRDELRKNLEDEALMDCTSKTCLTQISDAVGAKRFLRAMVEASGASYKVELELLDVDGASMRKLDESCAVCTIVELSELIAKVAESLMTTREDKPTPVVIVTQPEGATLQLDGKLLGPAPFTGELTPGEHRITAHLAGHSEVDQTIDVKTGDEQQRFELILAPVGRTKKDLGPKRPFKILKFAAAGGSVAALIAGGYIISFHHDGTDCTPGFECENRYNTLAGGLATVGLGLALGGASGWMWMRDKRDAERKPAAAITPTRGGAYATFHMRF